MCAKIEDFIHFFRFFTGFEQFYCQFVQVNQGKNINLITEYPGIPVYKGALEYHQP